MPGATTSRPPTMTDVATRAGVSHQTVSRVLNGMPGVRPATAERVHDAIATLGYHRNLSARLLASSRSRTVGVVTWGAGQFGPQNVFLGLDAAARNSDYRLTMRTVHEISLVAIRAAVAELMESAVEAVVLIVPHEVVLDFAQGARLGVPTIVVAGDLTRTPLTAGVDNLQGARLVTRHLLELGHETVVHVAGPPGWSETAARVEGWRLELRAWGRRVPPLRWGGDWSSRSGFEAGVSLARESDITAVFAANDQMALGILAALRDAGRRVPEDVSVAGFDDLPESPFFRPPLTTVRQDFVELGHRVMGLVERVLAGDEQPSVDLVPTTLVVRASTASPPRSVLTRPPAQPGTGPITSNLTEMGQDP